MGAEELERQLNFVGKFIVCRAVLEGDEFVDALVDFGDQREERTDAMDGNGIGRGCGLLESHIEQVRRGGEPDGGLPRLALAVRVAADGLAEVLAATRGGDVGVDASLESGRHLVARGEMVVEVGELEEQGFEGSIGEVFDGSLERDSAPVVGQGVQLGAQGFPLVLGMHRAGFRRRSGIEGRAWRRRARAATRLSEHGECASGARRSSTGSTRGSDGASMGSMKRPKQKLSTSSEKLVRPEINERAPDAGLAMERAVWTRLYRAAQAVREQEPWHLMGDSERFGVVDPVSGETDWGVVMGGGGEFLGFGLYVGDEGGAQLEQLSQGIEPEEFQFGQRALLVSFVKRGEVPSSDRERMKELGFSFRGENGWPNCESHGANRVPRPLDAHEAERLACALEQVLAVLELARDAFEFENERGERYTRRSTRAADSITWTETWVRPPKPRISPAPEFDGGCVREVVAQVPALRGNLECGCFAVPATIDGEGDRYFPAICIFVDANSGVVLHMDVVHPSVRLAAMQEGLLKAIQHRGARPNAVHVGPGEVERTLAPLATALGIRLKTCDQLPALEQARFAIEDSLLR